jgi:hypothetical protein
MYSENNPVEQELIDQLNSAQSKLSAIAQEPLVFFSSDPTGIFKSESYFRRQERGVRSKVMRSRCGFS